LSNSFFAVLFTFDSFKNLVVFEIGVPSFDSGISCLGPSSLDSVLQRALLAILKTRSQHFFFLSSVVLFLSFFAKEVK